MMVIERKFCGGHLDGFFEIIDISLRLHIFYTPIHVLFYCLQKSITIVAYKNTYFARCLSSNFVETYLRKVKVKR